VKCSHVSRFPGLFGRGLLLAAAWACVFTATVCAADQQPATKPPQKDESWEALKKDFDDAYRKFADERRKEAEAALEAAQTQRKAAEKALKDAKTDEEKQAAQRRLEKARAFPPVKAIGPADGPGETFSPRFLAFAVKSPKDPATIDAFFMALLTSGGPSGKVGTWGRAVKSLQADHVKDPALKKGVRLFRMLAGARDEAADKLLRDVMARNPDRRARGRACQALAQGRASAARLGKNLEANATFRRNAEGFLGGKEGVERLIAGALSAKKEAEELARTVREKYDDVCPDLSIGKPAPEVVSQGLDGKPVKLSALKGKVVVLDVWTTWCGPCKAMIPHERAMVERLKDKPFVLVSISADEKKETLTKFLSRQKMPWTHWWNGYEGGILEDWDVQGYPTIYVLDAKCVIRYKDLRGEKLEEAVNKLLKERAKEQD
jgi:thiol-disulfide isomerase/thioredoxin